MALAPGQGRVGWTLLIETESCFPPPSEYISIELLHIDFRQGADTILVQCARSTEVPACVQSGTVEP